MLWCYWEYTASALLQEDNEVLFKATGMNRIVTSKGAIPQKSPLILEKLPVIS